MLHGNYHLHFKKFIDILLTFYNDFEIIHTNVYVQTLTYNILIFLSKSKRWNLVYRLDKSSSVIPIPESSTVKVNFTLFSLVSHDYSSVRVQISTPT